jgi:hypothetical protein
VPIYNINWKLVIKSVSSKHYPNLTKVYPSWLFWKMCSHFNFFWDWPKTLGRTWQQCWKNQPRVHEQYRRSSKRRGEGGRLLSLTLLFLSTDQLGLKYLDFLISQIFTKHLYLNWDKSSLEPCWWQTVGGFAGSYTVVKMESISAFAQVYKL